MSARFYIRLAEPIQSLLAISDGSKLGFASYANLTLTCMHAQVQKRCLENPPKPTEQIIEIVTRRVKNMRSKDLKVAQLFGDFITPPELLIKDPDFQHSFDHWSERLKLPPNAKFEMEDWLRYRATPQSPDPRTLPVPFEYWQLSSQRLRFPVISQYLPSLLSCPCVTSASERGFSTEKWTRGGFRSRLNEDTATAVSSLNRNIPYLSAGFTDNKSQLLEIQSILSLIFPQEDTHDDDIEVIASTAAPESCVVRAEVKNHHKDVY